MLFLVIDIFKFYLTLDNDKHIYLVLRTSKFSDLNWWLLTI